MLLLSALVVLAAHPTPLSTNGGGFPNAKYYGCQQQRRPLAPEPWCDLSRPFGERAAALAGQMNETEIVGYILGAGVGRLWVPQPPRYGEESLHGVVTSGCPFSDRW